MKRVCVFLPCVFLVLTGVGQSQTDVKKLPEIKGWGKAIDPAGDCKIVEEKGKLTITVPGTHHDLNPTPAFNNVIAPRVLQEIEGDFTLQVKVDMFERPKANTSANMKHSFVGAGLLVWQDDKNFIRFLRAANGESGALFATLEIFRNGMLAGKHEALLTDKPTHMRLSRKVNAFSFATSEDGKTWRAFLANERDVDLPKKATIGVAALNSTTKGFAPRFEELVLTTK